MPKAIGPKNIDQNTKTAMKMFGIKAEEVTDAQRRLAKNVNFGII